MLTALYGWVVGAQETMWLWKWGEVQKFEQVDSVLFDNFTEGQLSGTFHVSDRINIRFSKGNLQYQASTGTWRFAEQQYDVVGQDNEHISATNDGWIDLFGCFTSGFVNFYPYLSDTDLFTYPVIMNTASSEYDWGQYNPISNGGHRVGVWRTLGQGEWNRLMRDRLAANLCAQAVVNGVNGYVLLPDKWVQPDGVSFIPRAEDCTSNVYDVEQWEKMEANGAVFLPYAGERYGTKVSNVGEMGKYWTISPENASTIYSWYRFFPFNEKDATNGEKLERRMHGYSVRLVMDVP